VRARDGGEAPNLNTLARVEVVELEPMLDLLADIAHCAPGPLDCSCCRDGHARLVALLHEHGRLS
jgi:hypothetical protein